jgi:hypothetical protein
MEKQTSHWFSKEVDIPKALQELHGERARVSTLLLTYLSGLIVAAVVVFGLLHADLPLWKVALAGLIFLDIGGGVVANFSASTQRYYQERPKLRMPFIALHVFHPAVLALLFPEFLWYFVITGLFTLAATFTVNAMKDSELQQNLSVLFFVFGIALSFFFTPHLRALSLFAPLFMVKLIMGFAVRRQSVNSKQ